MDLYLCPDHPYFPFGSSYRKGGSTVILPTGKSLNVHAREHTHQPLLAGPDVATCICNATPQTNHH